MSAESLFHKVHGCGIGLQKWDDIQKWAAWRRRWTGVPSHNAYILFSERPLVSAQQFTVRIEGRANEPHCSIGVTFDDPGSIRHTKRFHHTYEISTTGDVLLGKDHVGRFPPLSLSRWDTLGVAWTPEGITLFHNGTEAMVWTVDGPSTGRKDSNPPVQPWPRDLPPFTDVWAVINLHQVDGVTVLGNFLPGCEVNEACATGCVEEARRLIEVGSSITSEDNYNRTPMDWLMLGAWGERQASILDILLHRAYREAVDFTRLLPTNTDGKVKECLVYTFSKYANLARKGRLAVYSTFARLCLCRAGDTDPHIVDAIARDTFEALGRWQGDRVSKPESEKFSPLAVTRICEILSHVMPLYFRNEVDVLSLAGETVWESCRSRLNWVIGLTEEVPTLMKLCASLVRHTLHDINPERSVVALVTNLQGILPHKLLSILCMDNLYNGEIKLNLFEKTYNYIMDHTDDSKSNVVHSQQPQSPLQNTISRAPGGSAAHGMTSSDDVDPVQSLFDFPNVPVGIIESLAPLAGLCIQQKRIYPRHPENFVDILKSLAYTVGTARHVDTGLVGVVGGFADALTSMIYDYGTYTIVPCGSVAVGLKIGDMDEFDYQLQRRVQVTDGGEWTLDGASGRLEYGGSSQEYQRAKKYLHNRAEHLLGGLSQPDDPSTGVPYVESCYPHSRAPGVCVRLAWRCDNDHKHIISVDITPAVLLVNRTLRDTWRPPAHLTGPFTPLRNSLLRENPVYVQFTSGDTWRPSFGVYDKHVYDHFRVMRCSVKPIIIFLKFLRESFFPKQIKVTEPKLTETSRCSSNELVSSYTIQKVVWLEVVRRPSKHAWMTEHLQERVESVLSSLLSPELCSFYTGSPESPLSVPTPEARKIGHLLHDDIKRILFCLRQDYYTDTGVFHWLSGKAFIGAPSACNKDKIFLISTTNRSVREENTVEVMTEPEEYRTWNEPDAPMYFYYSYHINDFVRNVELLHKIIKRHWKLHTASRVLQLT